MSEIEPIIFKEGKMKILDQTKLPLAEEYLEITDKEDIFTAIKKMKVRGAPAIGVAAAVGLYVSVKNFRGRDLELFKSEVHSAAEYIGRSRPTAVNLFWALNRMEGILRGFKGTVGEAKAVLKMEAERIKEEDEQACLDMGKYGLSLLKPGMGILTHCNAGILATAKYGTCLSPIYLGAKQAYNFKVFADETRPALQGARLTAWELSEADIDVTLICDNMASIVMKNGWIDAVVVGCDRMAANGDGANKIGTSAVAILAKEYGIPFYMFVPTSTIDLDTETGRDIDIELRDGREISHMWYREPMAPEKVKVYNPSFDVTDNKYITAVVTEKGVVYPPYSENLRKILEK